jgi:hypothetical protein
MTRSPRLVALGVGFLLVAAAKAADVPKPPPPTETSRAMSQVRQMRNGNLRVAGETTSAQDAARNRQMLKIVAEHFAYSVAAPPYNGEPIPRDEKNAPPPSATMALLMRDLESFAAQEGYNLAPSTGGKVSQEQLEYAAEFGKAIATAAQVVLEKSAKPIERVNTVRLMSIVARIPAPDLVDPLVAVVNNPKGSDAEKLYAFEGLRNLLEQHDETFPDRHIPELHRNPDKLAQIGQALTNYITAKRPVRDDKDRAVIEFVRRHAVEAMARFKDAVLRKPNKDLIYRPSWTLARVMENDPSASPPFTVPEVTEAAIGFCLMKVDPDMNLDLAAFSAAKAVVTFARAANLDGERARRDGTPVAHPWKVYAARLSYALASWREATKSAPADRNPQAVGTLAATAVPLLAILEKEGAKDAQIGNEIQTVITWGTNNPPKAWASGQQALLYRDDPNSRLPFPAAAAPTLRTPAAAPAAKKEPEPKKAPADAKKAGPPKK